MNSEHLDFWSEVLWEYYSKVLVDDKPFYLAADGKLISDLAASKLDLPAPDPLLAFHQACCSALNLRKNGIKAEIFKRQSDLIPSRTICLAIQQVLIVEQMLADDDYSEAEYFPRYRSCLGLPVANANPLGDDFNRIWETLSAELEALCSDGKFVRTFWPGLSRKLRTTNFPLSQALFTTEDLQRIKRKAIGILSEETTDRQIFYFLQQLTKSNVLCTRARNLIRKCSMDTEQRLCAQVRTFLLSQTEPSQLVSTGRERSIEHSFIAEREPDEWFSEADYFIISLRVPDSENQKIGVVEALEQYLSQKAVLAFGIRDFFFAEINSKNPYDSQDQLLIVVPKARYVAFEEAVNEIEGSSFESVTSNVDEKFSMYMCNGVSERFCSKLGIIADPVRTDMGLKLEGGIRIDARTNTFLTGYPPNVLSLSGEELSGDVEVIVDHKRKILKNALEELKEIRDEKRSSIEFDGKSITFSLVPSKEIYETQIVGGFRFSINTLEPTAKALSSAEDALRGVHLVKQIPSGDPVHERVSQANLIGLVGSGRRVPLSPAEISALLEMLECQTLHQDLAKKVASIIQKTRSMILNNQTASLLLLVKRKVQ